MSEVGVLFWVRMVMRWWMRGRWLREGGGILNIDGDFREIEVYVEFLEVGCYCKFYLNMMIKVRGIWIFVLFILYIFNCVGLFFNLKLFIEVKVFSICSVVLKEWFFWYII